MRPILIYNTLMVLRSFLSILHLLFYSKFFFASINGGPFAPTGPCRKPRKVGSVGDLCGALFLGEFMVISFQFLRKHSSVAHDLWLFLMSLEHHQTSRQRNRIKPKGRTHKVLFPKAMFAWFGIGFWLVHGACVRSFAGHSLRLQPCQWLGEKLHVPWHF